MPPFNGSGSYSLPAGNPVTTGTTISSTTHNNTLADIASAMTNCLTKDGQTTPVASIPMGGYAHTGVADATARTQYAKVSQVQDGGYVTLSSVSGADTITATCAPAITAYAAGQFFTFVSAGANTGAVTLNINSLGAKAVTKEGTTALAAGEIASGAVICVEYDGTRFQIVGGRSVQPLDAQLTTLADGNATIAWPVGSVFTSVVPTNPATLLGGGTWVAFGAGRVLVGLDAGQTEFDTVEETGGAKTHTLSAGEMPAHTHAMNADGRLVPKRAGYDGGIDGTSGSASAEDADYSGSQTTGTAGSGGAHNNLQPYIVVYFWKRTA